MVGSSENEEGELPATWSVIMTTEARNGTRAFDRFLCGTVTTDVAGALFLGADCATSMTLEITAQVYAAVLVLCDLDGVCVNPFRVMSFMIIVVVVVVVIIMSAVMRTTSFYYFRAILSSCNDITTFSIFLVVTFMFSTFILMTVFMTMLVLAFMITMTFLPVMFSTFFLSPFMNKPMMVSRKYRKSRESHLSSLNLDHVFGVISHLSSRYFRTTLGSGVYMIGMQNNIRQKSQSCFK